MKQECESSKKGLFIIREFDLGQSRQQYNKDNKYRCPTSVIVVQKNKNVLHYFKNFTLILQEI